MYKVYGLVTLGGVTFPGVWMRGKSQTDVSNLRDGHSKAVKALSDDNTFTRSHSGLGEAYRAHHGRFAAYHDTYSFTSAGQRSTFSFWVVEE